MRYNAWGEERPACGSPPCGTTPTTYRYTGQRWEAGLGLYFYNARWYDPALSRFVQADTIVPQAGNPQGLNRYSYVLNQPLGYTDPTGHQHRPAVAVPDDVPTKSHTAYEERQLALTRHYRSSAPTMAFPVAESSPVTGPFGAYPQDDGTYSAYKNREGNSYCHPGVDYGVPEGTRLQATKDGIVAAARYFGKGYGWGVVIRHPGAGGAYTVYYHMKAESPVVRPGQPVLAGDPIGLSGDTGTGAAHLHFEIIRPNGLTWDENGMFHYSGGYYPYNQTDLASRISPSEWFGPAYGSSLEAIDLCPP